jgi:hypothetical protein
MMMLLLQIYIRTLALYAAHNTQNSFIHLDLRFLKASWLKSQLTTKADCNSKRSKCATNESTVCPPYLASSYWFLTLYFLLNESIKGHWKEK